MKIKLPKTDRLFGVAAMFISLLSLIFFIQQTNIMNEQSRLSVKPRLVFDLKETRTDSSLIMEQFIQNKGLGPAIVKKATIEFEGYEFNLDFNSFIYSEFAEIDKYGNLHTAAQINDKTILLQNEAITIFKFEVPFSNLQNIAQYMQLNDEMIPIWNFKIEYTSLYEDETWLASEKEHEPNQTGYNNGSYEKP